MGDLVILRNLIRAVSLCGQCVEAGDIFHKVAFGSQFECISTRATNAINIKAIVLTFEFLSDRTARACVGTAGALEGFARRYARLLRNFAHIEVKSSEIAICHRSLQSAYRLAKVHSIGAGPKAAGWSSRSTRSASSVFRNRQKRPVAARQVASCKQKADASSMSCPR